MKYKANIAISIACMYLGFAAVTFIPYLWLALPTALVIWIVAIAAIWDILDWDE